MKEISEWLKLSFMLTFIFCACGMSNDYHKNKAKFENILNVGDTLYINNEARIVTLIEILDNQIYVDNGAIIDGDYALKLKINSLK